jgi:tRNA C32,U32 (ribose-2'-O)-methylase TrmJ
VQIVAYELRTAAGGAGVAAAPAQSPAATAEELEGFYRHLEETLVRIGYLDPAAPKLLMRRLRRLFSRAEPDRVEVNILRGILAAAVRASVGAPNQGAAPARPPHQPQDDPTKDASG